MVKELAQIMKKANKNPKEQKLRSIGEIGKSHRVSLSGLEMMESLASSLIIVRGSIRDLIMLIKEFKRSRVLSKVLFLGSCLTSKAEVTPVIVKKLVICVFHCGRGLAMEK